MKLGAPVDASLSAAQLSLFPLPVLVYDPVTLRVLEVNDVALRWFGHQRETMVGSQVIDMVANDYVDRMMGYIAGLSDTDWSSGEWQLRRADGSCFEARSFSRGIEWEGRRARLAVVEDLTEPRRHMRALEESEQQYRATMGAALVGVYVLQDFRFRYVNPELCRYFGYSADELVDKLGPLDLVVAEEREYVREQLARRARGEPGHPFELTGLRRDGSHFPFMVFGAPSTWRGQPASVGTVFDLSEIKAAEDRIRQLAYFDPLTGLPNRSLLEDRAGQVLVRAGRDRRAATLMFIDLDRFKTVNDSLGHLMGDQLLRLAGQRLRDSVRLSDTVARLGGDEFIVLAPDTGAEGAVRLAEKILEVFAAPFDLDDRELTISPSIGIARYPDDGKDFPALLQSADIAMYQAKREGRNGFRMFSIEMNAPILESLLLETQLRRALDHGQLSLVYQPMVDIASGRIVGAEALLRWQHPQHGEISPVRFIPVAEESGLILPIGEWVLEQALGQVQRWRAAGHPDLVMAVNLSALQFERLNISNTVLRLLDHYGLPGSALELELTESVLMEDAERAVAAMLNLADRGVRLSVDDFGTGYSSLAYLTRLPLAKLKIDRSFVRNIPSDASARSVARTILDLARSLALEVIAEGVENEAQLLLLREWCCDQAQGYLYSRPVPARAFEALLRAATLPPQMQA
ncbi:putative bifunctional diguanylate cyclase/phosphodiesterase [Azoarcus olearius]|uniref:GGDEF/EAL/PAS/PAC-domain containing protein n=1 Tax=Azoarcus sp. (strain BH72) TaxID=418699 RepID=A1KCA9_AZOSB|nr:EAL domain-containing protein [Azoarcus olearius]ANQ87009.1 diguanylate cyclase [Azoarcus olearius]CAL96465.1 GGDEF/EAL/PAS/PAC-domain containing protein [Azoarcus olearius]